MKKVVLFGSVLASLLSAWANTSFKQGEWLIEFLPEGQTLHLSHAASGADVTGALSFLGPERIGKKDAKQCEWKITPARDGLPRRLALVDPRENVQGYLTFQSNGSEISFLVYHRTAQSYPGLITYDGTIKYRLDAFAASTTALPGERVLRLASGDADSLANDTLFSREADEALKISDNLSLTSSGPGLWQFQMFGRITEHAESSFSWSILRDYYKSRWVPYYKPIDRTRAPKAPTGWMSWNTYFDTAGSKENLAEARLGAKYLKPFGLEFWSIESWQENSSELPVSKFYNMNLETHPEQFPEGMKWLAGEIRKLGFRPGIWTAPFGTGNTNFYKAHQNWFLHDEKGEPISCWNGRYTLDPTVKEAREHLKKIHDIASHEWGYEFFKIDGMSGRSHGYCAHLYERPEIRARFQDPTCPNPFELCVKAFREGIGEDRVFLACQGHFTGAEAAYADASRTGADVVGVKKPIMWHNIMHQAQCTANQIFAHNIVFWSDPDCMLVSQQALAKEQARVEATVISLPGQQMFAGDKLASLAPDRIRLLQQALPVCDVHPAALYPLYNQVPIWDLNVKRPFGSWHVVALFNWEDKPQTVGFDWTEIGEAPSKSFACWEFWTESYLGFHQDHLELEVPPHSVRLVTMHPNTAHPQFLTSDRHMTQGGVELKSQRWLEDRLEATIEVIGSFPLTARFVVPPSFQLKSFHVDEGVKAHVRMEAGGDVIAVELSSEQTTNAHIRLQF